MNIIQHAQDYIILKNKISVFNQLNKMTVTQFSDILRWNLLSNYGGLWMDVSVKFFSVRGFQIKRSPLSF